MSNLMPKIMACLFTVSIALDAMAANYITKAYQAVYDETSSSLGNSVRSYASDGKGHGRSEVTSAKGRKTVAILDLPNNQLTILMDETKSAMTIPLSQEDLVKMGECAGQMKAKGIALGAKVIDGHPCHGWHYNLDGISQDLWIGDDIGIRVYSKVQGKFGTQEAHLRSYSGKAPDPSLFLVPAGYHKQ
jgi:hypothetical protein